MNELTKSLYCIQMRSGVEIWLEQERAEKLQSILEKLRQHMFVAFDDRTVNTADIVGVFNAQDMAEFTRRKNGEWKCREGNWHEKGTRCECVSKEREQILSAERQSFYERHGYYPAY